jgi:hypothetical protein
VIFQGETLPHACLFHPHHLVEDPLAFEEDVIRAVDLSNIHQHTKTCTKREGRHFWLSIMTSNDTPKQNWGSQIKPIKKLKKSEVVDEKTDTQKTNSSKRKKKKNPESEIVLNPTKKAKIEKKESSSNIQEKSLKKKSLPSIKCYLVL